MAEIFQFEVSRIPADSFIFLFTGKSMKKFEIYTIDGCYVEEHL